MIWSSSVLLTKHLSPHHPTTTMLAQLAILLLLFEGKSNAPLFVRTLEPSMDRDLWSQTGRHGPAHLSWCLLCYSVQRIRLYTLQYNITLFPSLASFKSTLLSTLPYLILLNLPYSTFSYLRFFNSPQSYTTLLILFNLPYSSATIFKRSSTAPTFPCLP